MMKQCFYENGQFYYSCSNWKSKIKFKLLLQQIATCCDFFY
ncbi:hypothetical protein HMPREF0653_01655 [Prevotella disiens JCM 6334 = ATCC 29426]|uniref:Uncharacterized protein n=1 Tax=Prevotella disiens JCM 6334 = ATCC 29426 TaxID=1235811 RepID=A0ABN0NRD9_9BACT|nr:hypothetical protein HMPREF0653_01655 [Prevotella disiens JCM 6334 = ATCC 29426]